MRVHAIEPTVPYDVTIRGDAGAWIVRDVPIGPQVEVVAMRPGWTTRRRVGDFQATGTSVDLAFGLTQDEQDWRPGAALFLSNYPEVERIEPALGTFVVDPAEGAQVLDSARVTLRITFSEPFDEATRQRLSSAVRLWPADGTTGHATAIDLARFADIDEGDGLADLNLKFGPIATSAEVAGAIDAGPGGRARATWDTDGRTMTIAVDGTIGVMDKSTKYQVGLVSDGQFYSDAEGLALGTSQSGLRNVPVPAGQLLANTFCRDTSSLALLWQSREERPNGIGQRWNAIHSAAVAFRVGAAR